MSRESAAVGAIGLALGLGIGGLLMFNKSDSYKARHGCKSCEYESGSLYHRKCQKCMPRKATKWTKKAPKPVYCECCGQEKHA